MAIKITTKPARTLCIFLALTCIDAREDRRKSAASQYPGLTSPALPTSRVKRIFFVRHGLALHNVAGQGHCQDTAVFDAPLVKKGSEQARALGQEFAAARVDAQVIIASPLWRTLQTAQLLRSGMRGRNTRTLVMEDAREHFSACTADSRGPISRAKAFFSDFDFGGTASDADPFLAGRAGRHEAHSAMRARVKRFLRSLRILPESSVVVVSHGTYIRRVAELAPGLGFVRVRPRGLPAEVLAPSGSRVPGNCQVVAFELRYDSPANTRQASQ